MKRKALLALLFVVLLLALASIACDTSSPEAVCTRACQELGFEFHHFNESARGRCWCAKGNSTVKLW